MITIESCTKQQLATIGGVATSGTIFTIFASIKYPILLPLSFGLGLVTSAIWKWHLLASEEISGDIEKANLVYQKNTTGELAV